MRVPALVLLLAASLLASGCCRARCCATQDGRIAAVPERPASKPDDATPEAAPEAEQMPLSPTAHAIYTGTGAVLAPAAFPVQVAKADVLLFGELHGNAAGSHLQHEVLKAIASSGRPFALAMEFFERDVQADVDAYLAGSLEEAEFLKRTRQGRAYPSSHRALIELCKAKGAPVIAANAPRPLVSAFRKTEDDYATFLAGLSEAERATLPRSTSRPDDGYAKRFMKLMGPKRGPTYFRSQALWDDAMAEAGGDFRTAHPDHLVVLIVGAFHVGDGGGTLTKLQARRPDDQVTTLVLRPSSDRRLGFDAGAKDSADVVVMVHVAPRKRAPTTSPHKKKPAKAGTS